MPLGFLDAYVRYPSNGGKIRVADLHHFNADPVPTPVFHCNVDPDADPALHESDYRYSNFKLDMHPTATPRAPLVNCEKKTLRLYISFPNRQIHTIFSQKRKGYFQNKIRIRDTIHTKWLEWPVAPFRNLHPPALAHVGVLSILYESKTRMYFGTLLVSSYLFLSAQLWVTSNNASTNQ